MSENAEHRSASGEGISPAAYIFAGPNGAGKTSAASALLPASIPLERFVNSDLIARHLRAGQRATALLAAGRRALVAVEEFVATHDSFALETTLSGTWTTTLLGRLARQRYDVVLLYFWLPNADVAVARVRARVAQGGHDVPELDVRRRYVRSLANFESIRRREAFRWVVIDGRDPTSGFVAQGAKQLLEVTKPSVWAEVVETIRQALGQPFSDVGE